MKKILVIDDAEFILESTSTLLRFEGYDVYTAPDGEIGFEEITRIKPHLILCDISMPKLNGYGVLEKVRLTPDIATTPFIFLTAFTEKNNMRTGMEKGADDYLIKPFTRDELIAAIDAQWHKYSIIEKHIHDKVEEVGRNVTYALPHEFRTVLNEVIGSAKYLNTTVDDVSKDEILELTSDIMNSSKRLLKITENFLIYVSIESFSVNPIKRKQLRTYHTAEPSAMINDFACMVAARHGRIEDVIIIGDYDGIEVEIATESFHKLIEEVIDNAFKFSKKGTTVKIESWVEGDMLQISIADHGRGMAPDQINGVAALAQFERKVYEQQGVGLGLVIAKRLVELHDGKFDLKSVEDKGTTLRFSLPIRKVMFE